MSGRLVILPHKSWNVWNQDNREKVARDERLHREAEEAKAAKEIQLLQEQNLEILRDGEVVVAPPGSNKNTTSQLEPFRLFEDLEKQHYARLGNEDYLKEKAHKELLQKKRDGIADWALGEGSVESSRVRPWYETLGVGESVASSSDPRSDRESSRKNKADPMGAILVPNTYEYQPNPLSSTSALNGSSSWSFLESAGANLDFIESKEPESSDTETSKQKKKSHKERKEDRKSKKRSKHKHDDSSDDEKSHKKSKKSKHHTETKIKTEGPSKAHDPWAELRAKRLEREAVEKKRAAVLLATVDVYGPGGISSSNQTQGYGQQYHPHLARPKR